ncbi:MAG: hypothetical protein HYZ27_11890, partial [Deltaproteobacteria bacterium]|nr:hypothetical protein [Deltaproteobacteria bacterium]
PVLSRLALLEPSSVEVLLRLARVAKEGGDATGQADALHRAAALTPDDALAAERLADAAAALAELPVHERRATALLEEALDRHPASLRAAGLLDRRLAAAGDHAGRARLFGRMAAVAAEPRARADALLRRAEIELDALSDPTSAMADALEAAEALPDASAGLVARIARSAGDPVRETAALTALVEASTEPAARLSIHRRLAELLLGPLSEPRGAEKHLFAILALEPDDEEAARTLERILDERGDPEGAARLLLARAARHEAAGADPATLHERAAHALAAAAEAAASRGDLARAIRLLEEAIGLEPLAGGDDGRAERLDTFYAAAGRFEDRLALLERRAAGQEPEDARLLLSRLVGALPPELAATLDE